MSLDVRVRGLLLGLATGSRSSYGLAAVALSTPAPTPGTPTVERNLGGTPGKAIAAIAAAAETAGDKLPQTPSRLEPGGLPLRVLNGAGCGVLMARRENADEGVPALAGVAGALVSSYAGAWFRGAAAKWFGHDAWGAVIEDGLAATFAVLGVRR